VGIRLRSFCYDDGGQDLTEYSLILALFVLGIFALAGTGSAAITTIWHKVMGDLNSGLVSASGG
jgi:Flp pilus assembly pilin Flp